MGKAGGTERLGRHPESCLLRVCSPDGRVLYAGQQLVRIWLVWLWFDDHDGLCFKGERYSPIM